MNSDKRQIGLTPSAKEVLDEMVNADAFENGKAAAKFAVAIAVNAGIEAGRAEGASTTWHVGDLDSDGELAALVSALYPDAEGEPYRVVEHLVNEGLRLIQASTRTATISEGKRARRLPDLMALIDGVAGAGPSEDADNRGNSPGTEP